MVHTKTVTCLQKTEALIANPSDDTLRYATLQLRMGIEFLFYELIPLYKEELPDDIATTKWRPNEIIDALLECNPDADQDARIAIIPSQSGAEANTPAIVKDAKAPNKRLLRQRLPSPRLLSPCTGGSPRS
jgi:hypothetical protein